MEDNMVNLYAIFDIKINNDAYLRFDNTDTLRLTKKGRNYLTFKRTSELK